MSERSKTISRLIESRRSRAAYIKGKLNILIPSQIRALRLASEGMSKQSELAAAAEMKQSRISAMETPGAVNFNLETLVRLASVFKVGLVVKFVAFSEMLKWENDFSQDSFSVTQLNSDLDFLNPSEPVEKAATWNEGIFVALSSGKVISRMPIMSHLLNSKQTANLTRSEDLYETIGNNTCQSPSIH